MRKIVNEKKYAEMCLREFHLNSTIIPTLIILDTSSSHNGHTQDEILVKLDGFMKEAYGDYNPHQWTDKFRDLTKQYCSDKYSLSMVDEVYISKKEMDAIKSVKKQELQRVAFSLLVNCKIRNAKRGIADNRVKDSDKDVFADANVRRSMRVKQNMLRELKELGLVEFPKMGLDILITFIDLETDFSIEKNRAITITSFDDFILDYYAYTGSKVIKCKECGKRVLVKGNARTQYCPPCKKEKQLEQQRNSMSKARKKSE